MLHFIPISIGRIRILLLYLLLYFTLVQGFYSIRTVVHSITGLLNAYSMQSLSMHHLICIRPFLLSSDLHTLCYTSNELRSNILQIHPSFRLLLGEHTISYDASTIPFTETILNSLGFQGNPDHFHLMLPEEPKGWKRKGTYGNERWLRSITNTLWKKSGGHKSEQTMQLYTTFMEDIIAPMLRESGETSMYYSKIPLLRTHFPCPSVIDDSADSASSKNSASSASSASNSTINTSNASKASNAANKKQAKRRGVKNPGVSTGRHTDGRFGHPTSEFNIWLPLNQKVWGTNSLFRDESRWSGEASSISFQLNYGEFVIFYGNQVPHQTFPNRTGITRCSLDFRVIPGSLFDNTGRRTYQEDGPYFTKLRL